MGPTMRIELRDVPVDVVAMASKTAQILLESFAGYNRNLVRGFCWWDLFAKYISMTICATENTPLECMDLSKTRNGVQLVSMIPRAWWL